MTDDKTDINDMPLRSPQDSSLSDTAMGSGIAQLEPSESMPDDEDILDLGSDDDGEIEDMEESVLDLGDADEDTLSGDSEILELSTELEELMDTHTDQEADDGDSDQEVIDVGEGNEASENAETAVSEPKTKTREPDANNEIFSAGNESSDAADNLAMLTGGSTEPKAEDLSVFGDQSDRKVDNNDIARLSEKPKPLTKELPGFSG